MDGVHFFDEGQIDVLVMWVQDLAERLCRGTVMTDDESLLLRAGHPLVPGRVTTNRLIAFPHVVVELTGGEARGADGFIDKQGVTRRSRIGRLLIGAGPDGKAIDRVAVVVPHYSTVVPIVERTDMIATLPQRLALQAMRDHQVDMLKLSHKPYRFTIEALWHRRVERDPRLQWLVGQMIEAMTAEDAGVGSPSLTYMHSRQAIGNIT